MSKASKARIEKTLWYINDPASFMNRLKAEIVSAYLRAVNKGMELALRLDALSDLGLGASLSLSFPYIQFYDYTKDFQRYMLVHTSNMERLEVWKNYHLTFSRSETNWNLCQEVLTAGGTVAVVFSPDLPPEYQLWPVVDGDIDDLRFLEPPAATIIGLRCKGKKKIIDRNLKSGFAIYHKKEVGDAN